MSNETKTAPEERRHAELIVERITKAVELINLAAANAGELVARYGWDVDFSAMHEAAAKVSHEALCVVQVIADEDGWKHDGTEVRK